MASHSRIIGIIFVGLALLCLPFVLCGTSEATVGGGATWMILLLLVSLICFIRAGRQAREEQADCELVRELLPNEPEGEP